MNRRVLFIIGSGHLGGRELQLLRLATELSTAGWKPAVAFITGGGPVADRLRSAGVPIWVPDERSERPSRAKTSTRRNSFSARLDIFFATRVNILRSVRTLRRAARQHRPGVVHAMLPTSIWLGLTVTARPGRRRIAGVYGFTPDMSPAVRRAYRRQLNRAHAVVCNAPHLAAEATREFGVVSERVHVVPNGVHLPEVVANVSSDPPRAVVVANFHPYKGYADLLRALALLPTDSKLSVHLCGGGHERVAMQQLSTELGLCSQVVFVEPPVDVRRELSLAQFAIHPSHTEGLSNSILEQLAFGLPVIACDVGGNSTLIKHGENGLLVPAADPDALAGAITLLAARPSLRIMMSASARLTAERFGWKACTDAHIDLYISLIRARRR